MDKLLNMHSLRATADIPGAPTMRLVAQDDVKMANTAVRVMKRVASKSDGLMALTSNFQADGAEKILRILGLWEG